MTRIVSEHNYDKYYICLLIYLGKEVSVKKIFISTLFVVLATFPLSVLAEQEMEKSLDAVVEVRITVPENASSAEKSLKITNLYSSGCIPFFIFFSF